MSRSFFLVFWFFFFFYFFFLFFLFFFFFQAEDGIRDVAVTGVQTCALPIFRPGARRSHEELPGGHRSHAEGERGVRDGDLVGGGFFAGGLPGPLLDSGAYALDRGQFLLIDLVCWFRGLRQQPGSGLRHRHEGDGEDGCKTQRHGCGLEDLRAAGLGQRVRLVLALPVERLRQEADFRIQRLLPRQLLPRVRRMAPHDRQQRARREVQVVVLRLAGPDRSEQHVVLALVHIVLLALELPLDLAARRLDPRRTGAEHQGRVGAHDVVVRGVIAARRLAIRQEYAVAVRP